ncbi:MAG: cell division ATP-binding protein FtsE [Tissierellia bacterium]|nr:cell division ATP-binding protein FtsE [Tissierellia bacterium]
MIKFNNVTKRYKNDVVAIRDINFEINDGDFVFLTGPSGAGKSTIIKLILKELDPDSGKIYLDGEDITRVPSRMVPQIRSKIGVVFQDFRLLQNRTVEANIAFILDIWGFSRAEKKEKIKKSLELVGLYHRRNSFPNQLSGGEQQRVSIARAISSSPSLLIADEPTGNLDPKSSWELMKYFEKINAEGTTVVMSTHSKEIVDRMKKRVIKLQSGEIVRDGIGGYYD